jgi:archaellum component FlaC
MSFVNELQDSLRKSIFTLQDFSIELPDSGTTLACIKFKHNESFNFSIIETFKVEEVTTSSSFPFKSISGDRTKKTKTKVQHAILKPGKYKLSEKREVSSFSDLTYIILEWCDYIRTELYALAPKIDPIEELNRQVSYDFEKNIKDPDAFFSEEEIDKINNKIDKLYDEIASLTEKFELSEKQLESVKSEFDEFKSSSKSYSKGVWARITNNKMISIIVDLVKSKEGRSLIFDMCKKLLN